MPKTKYSIKVPHNNTTLYRICKELEKYDRSSFSFPDDPKKQQGTARSLGIKGKSLVERDLMLPVTGTRHRHPPVNIVALPVGVEVVEKKRGNYSRFYFRRIPKRLRK